MTSSQLWGKQKYLESSIHLRELQIQRSILKAWGFHWQIHDESGGQLHHKHQIGRDCNRTF
jgi:hypothetical protein